LDGIYRVANAPNCGVAAPSDQLKGLQSRVADLLYDCCSEIDAQTPIRKPISHGFRRSRSIVTNGKPHTNRRYVLNLDLENFFPSINFGRVRGFFIKNWDFSLNPKVATVLAQIACHETLPQGSPCSPIISDLIAQVLDVRLVRLAKAHKCTYSRYADDLTFSTNQKQFPSAIAHILEGTTEWALGAPLISTIQNANFAINSSKTRMQSAASRQTVTGLTVNKKVNIRADYYRLARSMCQSLFKSGTYFRPGCADQPIASINQIEGVLNHIHYVKNIADKRKPVEKKKSPLPARRLYKDLLFFKYFVCLERPLVLCEGKTDPVYLKAAIQQLAKSQPHLAELNGKQAKLKISFFNYGKLAHEILQLGNGATDFIFLMQAYGETLEKFKYAPLKHPVIILVDNDDGAKPVFSTIKQIFKQTPVPSHLTTAPFYHLSHNLYFVKTPEKALTNESKIEDLFDGSLLANAFDGKFFNSSNAPSESNEIGKTAFSKIVHSNADKIDFSGFSPLLDRIVEVIKHYKPPTV
jgi:RNA-directed DNA polymerase